MKRNKVVAMLAAATLTMGTAFPAYAMDANQFKDVPKSENFFKYVEDVKDLGIMDGEKSDEFGVEVAVTRGDVVSYLYKTVASPDVQGDSKFEDARNTEYANAAAWAEKIGLFDGLKSDFFKDGKFDGEKEITRSEFSQFITNLASKALKVDTSKGAVENLDEFKDKDDVASEYEASVKWVVGNKLMSEEEADKFLPNEAADKLDVAQAISVVLGMVEDDDVVIAEDVVANKNEGTSKPNNNTNKPSKEESNHEDGKEESKHEHTWKDITKEVFHPAEGHYVTIEKTPAWDEEKPVRAEMGHSEWKVDKAAYDEVVQHPEEGHYEKVEVSPEEGHFETVHHEAVTEQKWVVDKPAVYEDRVIVDKEAWDEEVVVVDKPAWDEEVEVPEQGHYETVVVKPAWDEEVHRIGTFCHNCGFEIHSIDEWIAHSEASNGQCMSYGDKEVTEIIHHEAVTEQKWVVDVPAHTEIVHHDAITHIEIVHHDAITHIERVEVSPEEGHYETVVIKPAYDEEVWVVDKEAVYEDKWIVDKEAWEEIIHHKEEGHWEWVVDQEAITEIIHHEAVMQEIFVVDKKAWTETVVVGRECTSCGSKETFNK
jgi:hypothetical protein